jgi:4-hydroxyacetophenone monooxygenase
MSRRQLPADRPVTEDDAFLSEVLESASIPALMMSLVHLTGDSSILRGPIRLSPVLMGEVQGSMSDEERVEIRARALQALREYRDRGCTLPPSPSPDLIHEMMSFVVGGPVPGDYVPMMREEMALDGEDSRRVDWADVSVETRRAFHVLVIGAGMSGLLTAIRLEEAGISYTVIEKNDAVGGTWYENSYPGCRVDVANHFYCYSFEPNHDWSEHFARREELRAYFDACSVKYGVREHIRFETVVVSARFDERDAHWVVCIRSADGSEEVVYANALVSAVGQLNRPKIPDIEGLADFAGPCFHSAAWEHEHALSGLRVAVVGTGASAFQLAPEVAKVAGHLTIFQRSPVWMIPNPRYHARVDEGVKWLLKHVPYYARWYRFLIFWPGSDGLMPSLRIDPDWPHPERAVNALNDGMRVAFTRYMERQLGGDPELLAKVVPTYPPFGKRMLQDNGSWLSTLKRDDVDLVTEPIERVTADAVICADDSEHPVDVIVFATGFHANAFLSPMEIVGRGGTRLRELWGDDPRAHLGITVPGFPNLFCLYGPGTNLAHAGSIIFNSECQVRYVMGCLRALLLRSQRAMDCKQAVYDAFNEKFDATHAGLVWSHPGMNSWYKNSKGRVTTTSPWLLLDYWRWTREPNLEEFDFL